jgi:AraC-like DNA-binding protein
MSLWSQEGEVWSGAGCTIIRRRSARRGRSTWSAPFVVDESGLVLPTAGGYRRRVRGSTQVVDRTSGLFHRRGEVAEIAQVSEHCTAGTIINLGVRAGSPVGAHEDWPSGTHLVDSRVDLSHRLLLKAIRSGAEPWLVELRCWDIIHRCLSTHHVARRGLRRRVDHRELAAQIVELFREAPSPLSLACLAAEVGYSPVHLTRAFREVTGVTMSEYRQRVRLAKVLDQLEAGAGDLAAVALDNGYSDHSHMTRAMVARLDLPPSRVRELLRTPATVARETSTAEKTSDLFKRHDRSGG